MKKSQQELAQQYIDKYGDKAFEKLITEELKPQRPKKTGLWPAKNAWWQSTKWIQELCTRYQFLVPVLDALKNHKAIGKERTYRIISELYKTEKDEYSYVLLDLSKSRKMIAGQIGCSEKTLSLYMRGLINCGVLKYVPHGRKKYYSLAYWREYPVDADNPKGEWGYKKQELLGQKTSKLLRDFELPQKKQK